MPRRRRIERVQYRWITMTPRLNKQLPTGTSYGELEVRELPGQGRIERWLGTVAIRCSANTESATGYLLGAVGRSSADFQYSDALAIATDVQTGVTDDFPLCVPIVAPQGSNGTTQQFRWVWSFDQRSKRNYEQGFSLGCGYAVSADGAFDSGEVFAITGIVRVLVSF